MPWARRITKRIPPQSSPKQTIEINDYSGGFNSFTGNDSFPMKSGGSNMWRVAKNARITTLGEYQTRKGVDFHSAAAGETLGDSLTILEMIDTLDSVAAWAGDGANDVLTLNTTDQIQGTGCANITMTTTSKTTGIKRLNATAIDLSSGRGYVIIPIYIPSYIGFPPDGILFTIGSGTDLSTNYVNWIVTTQEDGTAIASGAWNYFKFDLSTTPTATVGTPVRTAIKSMSVVINLDDTPREADNWRVDFITLRNDNGNGEQDFSFTQRLAQKFTATSTNRLTKVQLNIKNDLSGTGTVLCEIWSDDSGVPDAKLATSSVPFSSITSSFGYKTFYFNEAPELTSATDYWIVIYTQPTTSGFYTVSTSDYESTALLSVDSGNNWTAQSYGINFKQYYATSGGVKGLFRAYKTDGTKVTLFVHGTVLYSVNNSTGALTVVKSGLSSSATKYRFAMVNDIIYYVNGFDGYRKWNFTTESQVSATNYTTITEHKGLMFLGDKTDPNKVVFSNFADYETFTSTDFIYVPAPKTGDPVTALVSLNGYLYVYTLNNKYILSGDDRDSFILGEAPEQRGTFTQETVTKDKNFMYYLSNDGVYRSNGSEAQLLSENVYQEVFDINDKPECTLQINGGRLYMWYQTASSSNNNECLVWNLNYASGADTVESRDTLSFASRAYGAFDDNNALLVASSLVGQVFWQELPTNDYTNAGGLIEFELSTPYMPFASPAVLKEIRYWNPRFESKSDGYSIACEYAYDLRENWSLYSNVNNQGEGVTYGDGTTFGSGATYGVTAEVQAYLTVPGEYRRIALRYKHYATRQPHTFLGHTLVIQTRRIR